MEEVGLVRPLKPEFGKGQPNLEVAGRILVVWALGTGSLHPNVPAICDAIVKARDYGV